MLAKEYGWDIVFQLEARVEDSMGQGWRRRHESKELKHEEIVIHLQSVDLYKGFPLAKEFGAGECSLCLPRNPWKALQRGAMHPSTIKERQAMGACGVGVFALAGSLNRAVLPIGRRLG